MGRLTIFVCTFNSGRTIARCLDSLRRGAPDSEVVVVDHESQDSTLDVCRRRGLRVLKESVGLGYARQLSFESCSTEYIAFVDSDVEVVGEGFFARALSELERSKGVGAVVGMALGHRYSYGLPASLLVLRTSDFSGIEIPDYIDARETYFIQERLDRLNLGTCYLADAMVHRSQYRGMKPEWEGSNTRLACGLDVRQLGFAFKVMVLMSLNSRSWRNMLYVPVFYMKFIRGFVKPLAWARLNRAEGA